MSKRKLFEKTVDLINDPLKVAIWLSILKNPGITAKKIKTHLHLRGTKIYYYLSQFERDDIVETEEVEVRNLKKKKYFINEQFFEFKESGEIEKMVQGDIGAYIFDYWVMVSILKQHINYLQEIRTNKLKELQEKDYIEELVPSEKILEDLLDSASVVLIPKEGYKEFKELYSKFKKLAKKYHQEETFRETVKKGEYGALMGIIPLKF